MRTRPSILLLALALGLCAMLHGHNDAIAWADSKGDGRAFVPSEKVSADQAVAFPTDI